MILEPPFHAESAPALFPPMLHSQYQSLMMLIAITNQVSFRAGVKVEIGLGPAASLDGPAIPLSWTLHRDTGEQWKVCKGCGDVSHRRCCDGAVIGAPFRQSPFIWTSVWYPYHLAVHCIFYSLYHSLSCTASHSLVRLRKSVVVKSPLLSQSEAILSNVSK